MTTTTNKEAILTAAMEKIARHESAVFADASMRGIANQALATVAATPSVQCESIYSPRFNSLLCAYGVVMAEGGDPAAVQSAVQALIAHIDARIARERQEGRRDMHEVNIVLVGENDKMRARLARTAAPSEDVEDCPACLGSSVRGEVRGVRCSKCSGRGYLVAAPSEGLAIPTVSLTGNQLRAALDIINPDGPSDELQCDDELTFGVVDHTDDSGVVARGMCCWNGDTDGVIPLDDVYRAPATEQAKPELAGLTDAMCTEILTKAMCEVDAWADSQPIEPTKDQIAGRTVRAILAAQPVPQASGERDALSAAARDVLAERRRQVEQEGWTAAHDDKYTGCELAAAAATYSVCVEPEQLQVCGVTAWPWPTHWWKPTTYRRNLVKAGALLIAEIERLDRKDEFRAPTDEDGAPCPGG